MQRSGFFVLCSALGVAGALGGCFDKGVIVSSTSSSGTALGGAGEGGQGGGGQGGEGGEGGATTTTSTGGGGPCERCYEGPAGTEDVGACHGGCREGGACVGQVLPAAEGCATEDEDESCDGAPACTGEHGWSTRFGGVWEQNGEGIALDSEGNILVSGSFTGGLGFADSTGAWDGFVVKLGPDGAMTWHREIGWNGTDRANLVARDAEDNVIVAGSFENTVNFDGATPTSHGASDVFVTKLSSENTLRWVAQIGGVSVDSARGLGVDSKGNILVAGTVTGEARVLEVPVPSGGGEDIFVAKLDPSGDHVWSRTFGDTDAQVALDLAVTPDDGVVVVGRMAGTVRFGTETRVAQGTDAFMVKLDAEGSPSWAKVFGDNLEQELTGVAVDAGGNIVVTGTAEGGIRFGGSTLEAAGEDDVVVAAFDSSGAHLWSGRYGDATDQVARDVAVDSAGNVLVAGEFRGSMRIGAITVTSSGNNDAFLIKLGPTGEAAWAKRFGDREAQSALAVTVDALGAVLLTGYFNGTIELGGDVLTSANGQDVFVARLQP